MGGGGISNHLFEKSYERPEISCKSEDLKGLTLPHSLNNSPKIPN